MTAPATSPGTPGLRRWFSPPVLAAAGLAVAAGFGQFGAAAALPDVAAEFGEVVPEADTVAGQAGLSGVVLGLGLAVIRLASLGALPLSGLADRLGRRTVLLGTAAAGLAATAAAAASPGYWWFVVIFALGRPALSTTNALAGVVAAEETRSADRAWAVALVTAGYGLGAGMTALIRGTFAETLSFRGLFLLAVVPLLLLPLAARFLTEPALFARSESLADRLRWRSLLTTSAELRRRFLLMTLLWFAFSAATGPFNTFLFVYGENVVGVSPGTVAIAVVLAGPLGLVGLLAGRASADRLGRLPTSIVAHMLVALSGLVVYSGSAAGVFGGYLLTIMAASAYAPATGALSAELFPTRLRGTAAGALTAAGVVGAVLGLVGFGLLADVLGSFTLAAAVIGVAVAVIGVGFLRLPETRGMELSESAPD